LGKVAIVWKIARPASDVVGRIRYADVAAVLRREVHHLGRKLDGERVHGDPVLAALLGRVLLVRVYARVVDVRRRLAQFPQTGQVEADLFLSHFRIRRRNVTRRVLPSNERLTGA